MQFSTFKALIFRQNHRATINTLTSAIMEIILCTTIRPKIRVYMDLFALFAHKHLIKMYAPVLFFLFLYRTTIQPNIRILIDLMVLFHLLFILCTAIRSKYMVLFHFLFVFCTTSRPKLRVLNDLFLLFAYDHSTKIYGLLSFIYYFFCARPFDQKLGSLLIYYVLFTHEY